MIKDYEAKYTAKYYASGGCCQVCGQRLSGPGQLAHRIAKSKPNIKKYGLAIVDAPANLALVCGLRCNASVLVRTPRETAEIVKAAS